MLPPADREDVAAAAVLLEGVVDGDVERVAAMHASIFAWAHAQAKRAVERRGAFVIGVTAPQGAGKSTLAATLSALFERHGARALPISIDDFYLSRAEQIALAECHPANPFLAQRGYPGTHDVAFGTETLRALRWLAPGASRAVPRYDKSAFGGLGDRAPQGTWPVVVGALDVIVLEGWMLAFAPLDPARIEDPWLREVNARLGAYQAWTHELDAFVHLVPNDTEQFVAWRVEAEERRKANGSAGLSREDAERYARLFIPAYAAYVPELAARPPAVPTLRVEIGADRLPRDSDVR